MSKPLYGYDPSSIGGQAIQRGRDKWDRGEQPYRGWPYLELRGWYDRKAESSQEA